MESEVTLELQGQQLALQGTLAEPARARGLVIFAHGSGSSRHSPRNRHFAAMLNARGCATLLMDLLTREEERADAVTAEFRFDIGLLARRLESAIDWVRDHATRHADSIGLFGSSTGAAAALIAAAELPTSVQAVVSRGGRPDLAGPALPQVRCPVLLIVGGEDDVVIDLNRAAAAKLVAPWEIEIVPGATHLFEEPGKLDEVARLAGEWFVRHLQPGA
jgi:dienelactone hydrolase